MLQVIRDRAQGIIAWVIVILIIIPFALWGINQYTGDGKEIPVAEVNDASISKDQLQTALQQQRQRLEQMLGQNFRPEMFSEAAMKPAMVDQLVERELMLQGARDAGLRVADSGMAALIRSISAFQVDGKFSQDAYERALRAQGMSASYFESQLRRDLLVEQLRAGLEKSAFATPSELDRYLRLQNQTRDFGYLLFPVGAFAGQVQISDDEVKRFYDEKKANFTQPEMVRIAYVELSADALAASAQVSEEQLRAYYDSHQDEFAEPESRRASHILISVAAGSSPDVEQAAQKKAEDVLKRLQGGESFATVAKQMSEDPGSAKQGGDLGFFERGVMDKAFEEKVFSLKKGELSEPVRSAFGYHIIRLEEVRGGGTKPLEEVRGQIRTKIGEDSFYDVAEKLNELTYQHPDTLQNAADELKLPVQHSDYFARSGGRGVAANPKVPQAAFSEDVLEQGNNSDTIEVGPNHLVVLRVEDRRPEAQRPVDEVRGQIVDELRREKARANARAAADKAMEALKAGTDPATLAKDGESGRAFMRLSAATVSSRVPWLKPHFACPARKRRHLLLSIAPACQPAMKPWWC